MWWQLYPLGFLGAPPVLQRHQEHRLGRLGPWLDYAADLGAGGVMLGPIFTSGTHGYDTVDHFTIDPRLGDDGDFDALVAHAHDRGLKVMLDGVFNHVGRGFGPFRHALEHGDTESWFHLTWPADGGAPRAKNFEGIDLLVALNHAEPKVADYVAEVMNHWLERGADAWRLDAAYAVPPEFWQSVLPRVRERHPGVYVVGEVIHGDYAGIVRRSGMDTVTQYELWKAVWSSLNDRNFFELAAALDRHNALLDTFVPLTFVGNHDVTRIASRLDDPALLPFATALLFTLAGDPSVYSGDEQAFRGVKEDRVGGDDAIRPAFPATPQELAPFGAPTHDLHLNLAAFRNDRPWLREARSQKLSLTNTALVLQIGELLLAMNIDPAPVTVKVPGATTLELGTPGQPAPDRGMIALQPMSWAILR